jgi:predicted AAA+ superfamily ATPase
MEIKRALYKEIEGHLNKKEITLIVGPRQVGKTTLMLELLEKLKKKGEKVVYLNLDYESDKRYFESQDILLNKLNLEIGKRGYVFIDEIQRKENAGLFLKGIYDMQPDYKFIISGSGSIELKEKIQESLTGRKRMFELLPVSFPEFVNYKTGYKYEDKLVDFFELEKEKTEIHLKEFLSFGGYPRVITEESIIEKRKVIDEIYRSYIEKDIISMLNIDRPDAFSLLIKLLAAGTGNILNYSQTASASGISVITLKKYLWYAEKTYIIKMLNPYFRNSVKELTKSRTAYFYDIGMRNFANNSFDLVLNQNETGFVFQNFIMNIISENLRWKGWSLHYWRTTDKAEVDFVINKNSEIIPLEVKYSIIKKSLVKRSLRSFIERYSPKRAFIVSLNYSDTVIVDNTEVLFIPFYKILDCVLFE